jgi:FkbM family methyltransferase
MDLSYTQNMEDYHLWLAFGGKRSGSYIDIGAGHPIADNVSFFFYERGWQGIVVEPQRSLIDLYARLRPRDTAVAALIGTQSGAADFHVFDAFHGLSTTSAKFADAGAALGAGYRTIKVPMMTLAALCKAHAPGAIDFLKIDVEGAEADVLRSGDWKRYRPKAIVIEAIAPGSNEPAWQDWEPYLLAQGYRFMLFDTLNRFYVAEEAQDIAAAFPRERASWDSVRHMYEIGRAPENAGHPEHALAKILARGFWSRLPALDRDFLADILKRARTPANAASVDAALAALDTEEFRARLGRIACGYDGGQIYKEDTDEERR